MVGTKYLRKLVMMTLLAAVFLLVACTNGGTTVIEGDLYIIQPAKTVYDIGEPLDLSGLMVATQNSDGTLNILDNEGLEISGYDAETAGKQTVSVVYDNAYEATFDVDVKALETLTETQVVIYEGPTILTSSDLAQIYVNDQELFVYETLVNHSRVFSFAAPRTTAAVAYFDFEGRVTVSISVPDIVESAVVRPLARNINVDINENTITFELTQADNYVIEFNDDTDKAIHLFANPLEENPVDPNDLDDDVIYLGPGVHKADAIPLSSNQTLYIAGGAVVYGQVRLEGVENVTIRGRGIIDGSIYSRTTASESTIPLEFRNSKNIHIEGISVLNPAGWVVFVYFSEQVTIDNLKIITARANGDGISINSSKDVLVANSFVRTWDDSLVVKNTHGGETNNVVFDNITVWTDLAQSMEVGYETNGTTMEDIVFSNITVLHNFHKPVMSIHNADNSHINGVIFSHITVEDAQIIGDAQGADQVDDNYLVELFIRYNPEWTSTGGQRGSIANVIFNNINVLDGAEHLVASLSGYDAAHDIKNVYFNNFTVKGLPIQSDEDLRLTRNDHVSHVVYRHEDNPTGSHLVNDYHVGQMTATNITTVESIAQNGLMVPDFAIHDLPLIYVGQRVEGTFSAQSFTGYTTLIYDDGSGPNERAGHEAGYAVDGNQTTMYISNDFDGIPYVTLDIAFDDVKQIGNIRIYGDMDADSFIFQNIAVYGRRATVEDTSARSRLIPAADYAFTPAQGNYIDIKLAPGNFRNIQLRFYPREGHYYADYAFTSGIEFYPASLTYNKSISATNHSDVYVAGNLVDGDPLTYYEAAEAPAEIIVDMAEIYQVTYVSLALPPLAQWGSRSQEIEVLVSTNGTNYETLVEKELYVFDSLQGNIVVFQFDTGIQARYLKVIIHSNSSGYGAQLSEINVFE